jgi:uncharacterized protein (TIGR02246 family)
MATVSPPNSSREAVRALSELVKEVERTQRAEDVEGFLELFDPHAVWVTSGGKRLIGLDIIRDLTHAVLPGAMSDGSVTYEVEHVLVISADVAVTAVRQQYFDLAGNPTSAGLPTYVWRRGTDGCGPKHPSRGC